MNTQELNQFYSSLYEKGWVPHIKKTFQKPEYTIKYLGRYTHNIAIANSRIEHYGILSNRCKKESIPLIRDLNGGNFYKSELANLTAPQIILKLYNVDVFKCPKCNERTLIDAADYFNQLE